MQIDWIAKGVGTVSGFISSEECDHYIQLSEKLGYEDAPVTTARGMVMMKDIRNNERVMFDDFERAAALYDRVRPFAPARIRKTWEPVGINERLRLYRYDVGQQFDWHQDGAYVRENGERSFFTFMVYLNDGFEGGATSFCDDGYGQSLYKGLAVQPEKGMALLFHHPITHRGDPVVKGRKYVLRSDIMYTRTSDTEIK